MLLIRVIDQLEAFPRVLTRAPLEVEHEGTETVVPYRRLVEEGEHAFKLPSFELARVSHFCAGFHTTLRPAASSAGMLLAFSAVSFRLIHSQ